MQALWAEGYRGDGLWGRGAKLGTGEWERNTVRPDEVLPEHLCGGTYQSRSRKRKAKPVLTYRERKERSRALRETTSYESIGARANRNACESGERVDCWVDVIASASDGLEAAGRARDAEARQIWCVV